MKKYKHTQTEAEAKQQDDGHYLVYTSAGSRLFAAPKFLIEDTKDWEIVPGLKIISEEGITLKAGDTMYRVGSGPEVWEPAIINEEYGYESMSRNLKHFATYEAAKEYADSIPIAVYLSTKQINRLKKILDEEV